MPIIIISGTPGTGKTSVARLLSSREPKGVHIESDVFFRFLAHRIDPSLPEAHDQNSTVVRAYVAAANEYSAKGYSVFLDGVIGPWMLSLITPMASSIEYVLLHAPLDVVLNRTQQRISQPSATPDIIARMHEQFCNIIDAYRMHVIHTNGKCVEEVANEYRSGSMVGAYVFRSA